MASCVTLKRSALDSPYGHKFDLRYSIITIIQYVLIKMKYSPARETYLRIACILVSQFYYVHM